MFNKQSMMQDAQKMLGQKGAGTFGQLFDLATNIVNTCQNPKAELEKHGVTIDVIRKAKNFLNFPGVGWLINKYGNKDQILQDLNKLEQLFEPTNTINLPAEQAPADELEQMQANLARLK